MAKCSTNSTYSGALILFRAERRSRAGLALGCCAMLLPAGCAVGPDYHRPTTPTPLSITESPLPGTADASQNFVPGATVQADWWRLFGSPQLAALVARAVHDNPSLEAAEQSLRQAEETTLAQRGAFFPSVSGQLTRQAQELSGAQAGQPGFSQTFRYYDAQLNVSYTFDIWGQTRRSVEADAAHAEYQRFQLEAAINMLAANTATAAINAASLAAQIGAEQKLLHEERQLLKTVRSQFELGAATGSDVATEEAQLAQTEALLPPLQTQLGQTRDQLAAYVGRVPAEAAIPYLALRELTLPHALPVSLPSLLVDQRPDIRASEAELHQASAQLGVTIAQRLPQLTLTGDIGSAPGKFADLFTPGNGTFTLANQILAPIFQGGTLLHQQRAAKAALLSAAATYQNTVVTAFQNVADVLVALSNDGAALAANQDAERAAARSLSLAQASYGAGGIAYLTVLTAQTQYQNAVLGLIRAEAARYTDTVALYAALGGGWWNRDAAKGEKS